MTLAAEGLAGKNQGQTKARAPELSRPGTGHGRSAFNPCDSAGRKSPAIGRKPHAFCGPRWFLQAVRQITGRLFLWEIRG